MVFKKLISHSLPVFIFAVLAAGSSDSETSSANDPVNFTRDNAGIYCRGVVKQLLRDPDSYKYEDAYVESNKVAVIKFRAKNGFGGYGQSLARCTTYRQGDQNWFRAELIE